MKLICHSDSVHEVPGEESQILDVAALND